MDSWSLSVCVSVCSCAPVIVWISFDLDLLVFVRSFCATFFYGSRSQDLLVAVSKMVNFFKAAVWKI